MNSLSEYGILHQNFENSLSALHIIVTSSSFIIFRRCRILLSFPCIEYTKIGWRNKGRGDEKWEKVKVYIAGAGCGDERLITLKLKNVIEKADCIVYDRLVNENILQYAKIWCRNDLYG